MLSGKTVKLILYEVLQFAALIVPIFVVMERFASVIRDVRGWDVTAYWLVVAASIAYVTSATLLVWVPLKYAILKQRRFITEITQWRPVALAYLILSTLPCFAILIASSKVQLDSGKWFDHFTELPVSLVLFSLICVDIIERIRPFKLIGKSVSLDPDLDMSSPVFTHLEQVSTISVQVQADEGQNGLTQGQPEPRNGSISGRWQDHADTRRSPPGTRTSSATYLYSTSSQPWTYSGPLSILWKKDRRSELFVESFLFWLDTVEMVRVAGEPLVFYSAWVFPVYIFAFLSALRMIVTPHSPLLSFTGVALQDLPFFIIRVALIAVFGYVTPVLYPLKNVLVTLTYIYFTLLSKLRIFKRRSMF
ncbi:transmembrane protein 236 [Melanotaenia boesemani]|uniref:transmembrane protein 236 n=1 Tax=Melanotaenia boesemani TaxID=1250792 RepID=UPI001C049CC0|nr:transmembrane protein 236 [Melanotaenia boesemani]